MNQHFLLKSNIMVLIAVIKNQEYLDQNIEKIKKDMGNLFPFVYIDEYYKDNKLKCYYTFDLNKAFSFQEETTVYVYDGNYDLNVNIKCNAVKIYGKDLSENNIEINNKPTIKVNRNTEIHTEYLTIKNIEFTYNNLGKDHYLNSPKFSRSVFLIFCERYIKISNCIFNGKCDHTYDTHNAFIHLDKKWCQIIKMYKNVFNDSYLYLEFGMFSNIKNNTFNNCELDTRMSNTHIYHNKFNGKTRLFFFNDYKSSLSNNEFNNVEDKYYIIKADHNSNINIFNNQFNMKTNCRLLDVDRGSTIEFGNNNVKIQKETITNNESPNESLTKPKGETFARVDFNGKLNMYENIFTNKEILIEKGSAFSQHFKIHQPSISINEHDVDITNVDFVVIKKN